MQRPGGSGHAYSFVMAGLVPAIHALLCCHTRTTWMPGTRPGMTATNAFPRFCTSPVNPSRHACFPPLLAPNKDREIGGGRATRQSGQVRKEAALTRSGSGRSSVSYLFFRANRARALTRSGNLARVRLTSLFRKPASRDYQFCGSIDDRAWHSCNTPDERAGQLRSRRLRPRRPAESRQALSCAGAKIPALQFRRFDRPGRRGPYRFECVRNRADPASLDFDRGARRRENHHGADSCPRAELRTAGRFGEGTDHPDAETRRALPGDHGKPAHGRAGNGCRIPYRHVHVPAFHDRLAMHAEFRHLDGRSLHRTVRQFVIQRAGKNPRRGGFPDAAHPGQNPGLRDPPGFERIRNGTDHGVLADQIFETGGPVFSRQHTIVLAGFRRAAEAEAASIGAVRLVRRGCYRNARLGHRSIRKIDSLSKPACGTTTSTGRGPSYRSWSAPLRDSLEKTGRRLTSDPIRTSLGLLPSGPDPIGEWLVHRQSPG